jgi:nucleoside-diphosphate-sugar epimerase
VNIATNSEITIQAVAEKIIEKINPNSKIELDETRLRPEKSEVFRLFGDNSKLKQYTGWKPETNFSDAIQQTIEWFENKDNLSQYKSGIYNL